MSSISAPRAGLLDEIFGNNGDFITAKDSAVAVGGGVVGVVVRCSICFQLYASLQEGVHRAGIGCRIAISNITFVHSPGGSQRQTCRPVTCVNARPGAEGKTAVAFRAVGAIRLAFDDGLVLLQGRARSINC